MHKFKKNVQLFYKKLFGNLCNYSNYSLFIGEFINYFNYMKILSEYSVFFSSLHKYSSIRVLISLIFIFKINFKRNFYK